jgi:hypothetical protein
MLATPGNNDFAVAQGKRIFTPSGGIVPRPVRACLTPISARTLEAFNSKCFSSGFCHVI